MSYERVTKFDGTNYQAWKFQMKAALGSNGLLGYVNGDEKKPDDLTKAEGKKWSRENSKAMFILSSAMDYVQLDNCITSDTAKEMWDKLSMIHEQKSAANKSTLLQRFYACRMDASEPIVQYISRILNLSRQLADLEEKISDVAIISKILGSLPSKYNGFVTAWDSVEVDKQTLATLQERLIKEEKRLSEQNEEVAVLVTTGNNRRPRQVERGGKHQHRPAETQRPAPVCYRCKTPGHLARNCPKRSTSKRGKHTDEHGDNKSVGAYVAVLNNSDDALCCASADIADIVGQIMKLDTSEIWLADSAASRHCTPRRDWFHEYSPVRDESIVLGDDGVCSIIGKGTIQIEKLINGQWVMGRLENVLHVPSLKKNLMSVGVCTIRGCKLVFEKDTVKIYQDRIITGMGAKTGNKLFRMFFRVIPRYEMNVSSIDLQLLHERAAHVNKKTLQHMINKGLVNGVNIRGNSESSCEACLLGKADRLPFDKTREHRKWQPGECFHSDVCGPMAVDSLGGARYILTFKDDATDYRFAYFLKHKSDVFDRFKVFERLINNKFNRPMKVLHTDNGGEYCNDAMKNLLEARGIKLETTASYTPQQNARAERDNRTIVESARTMLIRAKIPDYLWAEAVATAVYTLNMTPTSRNPNTTPYEAWLGKKPNLKHLRVFGSAAYRHIPKNFRKKLDDKGKKTIFVGYQHESDNYRLFDPQSRKIVESRDVRFIEKFNEEPPKNDEPFLPLYNVLNQSGISDTVTEENEDTIKDKEVERTQQENQLQENLERISPQEDLDGGDEKGTAEPEQVIQPDSSRQLRDRTRIRRPEKYEVNIAEIHVPQTYQEAITGKDSAQWRQAIEEELVAHEKNQTWTITALPDGRVAIDSTWVFSVQEAKAEKKRKCKARLCARGFRQKQGRDFNETFAPVVRYESIRIMFAIAAQLDLEIIQFDIKTAFLHGELKEEVYMKIPAGVSVDKNMSGDSEVVCKLNKALYGLKQASREWNECFKLYLYEYGFVTCNSEHSIFTGLIDNERAYIMLFVDDGCILAKNKKTVMKIISILKERFEITMCEPDIFVGMNVERDRAEGTIFVHQTDYAYKILERFNMVEACTISTPMEKSTNLNLMQESELKNDKNYPYRELIGSLMFLSTVSRPDLMYAVSFLSRFLDKFDKRHWMAAKRVLQYVKKTVNLGITYRKCEIKNLNLIGFCDSDYAGDEITRKSTSGYIFELNGSPVSWCSQRQSIVTLSSTEAEYVAATTATKEAVWLRQLLNDLGFPCVKPTMLKIDNQSAIQLIKNPVFHRRTKHIEIQWHFAREKYQNGVIEVDYVPSKQQLADIMTKALPRVQHEWLCEHIGLCGSPALLK